MVERENEMVVIIFNFVILSPREKADIMWEAELLSL